MNNDPKPVVIVRVKSSAFKTKSGCAYRRDLLFQRRHCKGFNFLEEDINCGGFDLVLRHFENFDSVKDGLYQVITTNEKRDWETGNVEEYDYCLVPFTP